jgi:hypothetical protein
MLLPPYPVTPEADLGAIDPVAFQDDEETLSPDQGPAADATNLAGLADVPADPAADAALAHALVVGQGVPTGPAAGVAVAATGRVAIVNRVPPPPLPAGPGNLLTPAEAGRLSPFVVSGPAAEQAVALGDANPLPAGDPGEILPRPAADREAAPDLDGQPIWVAVPAVADAGVPTAGATAQVLGDFAATLPEAAETASPPVLLTDTATTAVAGPGVWPAASAFGGVVAEFRDPASDRLMAGLAGPVRGMAFNGTVAEFRHPGEGEIVSGPVGLGTGPDGRPGE